MTYSFLGEGPGTKVGQIFRMRLYLLPFFSKKGHFNNFCYHIKDSS